MDRKSGLTLDSGRSNKTSAFIRENKTDGIILTTSTAILTKGRVSG